MDSNSISMVFATQSHDLEFHHTVTIFKDKIRVLYPGHVVIPRCHFLQNANHGLSGKMEIEESVYCRLPRAYRKQTLYPTKVWVRI